MNAAVFWSGAEALVGGLFALTSAFLIARLIGPEELGVAATAVAVHVVLWVAANALFADALVQRATTDDRVLSTAFWSGAAVGSLAGILQVIAGLGLAALFREPRLAVMGVALAWPLPLVGMAGAAQGLLTRRGSYRALALRTVLGQGSGLLIGLLAARFGAGAWSAVWQQAVTSGLGAVVLLAAMRWRPAWCWHWQDMRALLVTGLPLTASTLTQIARYRVFAVLIGACAGPAQLGLVHMAFRLVDAVRDLAFTALWRLLLPDLARFQHDRTAMLARVDRLVTLCAVTILPLCGALALLLDPVVRLLLGPAWTEAGAAALPLVGLMAVMAVTFPAGVALIAFGLARFTLYANLGALAASVLLVVLLRPATAWDAVLIWCASQLLVLPYILWVNGRALGVGPLRTVRLGVSGWIAALVLGLALGIT
jgi:PST family polysaccharide transporter